MSNSIDDQPVHLWFESIQGMSEGQRVHLGERATFYPDKGTVIIEKWGPSGNSSENVQIPNDIRSKRDIILYLQEHDHYIPSSALQEAENESDQGIVSYGKPSEGKASNQIVQSLAAQHNGQKFTVDENAVLLGRDAAVCQIVYKDGTQGISREHCVLTWDEDQGVFLLMDLDSSYGTFLEDGTKLEPRKPYRLHPGDRFYLAEKENMIVLGDGNAKQKPIRGEGEKSKKRRRVAGTLLKIVGWILIVLQLIAVWSATQTGGFHFSSGIFGLGEIIGYFLPGILGIVLRRTGIRMKEKA